MLEGQLEEESSLIFITREGDFFTRVLCTTKLECTGVGDEVFWTFLGSTEPLIDSDTRFTNTSELTPIEGQNVITATLNFAPAETSHESFYVCQILGDVDTNVAVNVFVDQDPLEIISEIRDIDITNQTVGDPITIACQVETCVSQVTVSIYREEEVIFSTIISNNQQESVTVAFSLIVEEDSAGQYACRAFAPEGSTPLSSFNIIGTPIVPSTSVSTTTSTTVSTVSTIANMPSPTSSTSQTTMSSTDTSVTPSMSPSSSPGGSAGLVIEWTVFLSLLLVTLMSVILV